MPVLPDEGTTIHYNGVTLKQCETKRFEQSSEYDESDTDLMRQKYVIAVSALVSDDDTVHTNAEYVDYVPQADDDPYEGQAVFLTSMIQKALSHPRGDFTMGIGGTMILTASSNPKSPFRDCKNGPKPRRVNITHIARAKALRIEFEIEIHLIDCVFGILSKTVDPSRGEWDPSGVVLNNRWSLTDSKDANFYSERRWEGTLTVVHSRYWPHLYRHLCVPPLQQGYRRMGQTFTQSADGLSLKYTVTDKQHYRAPPSPASDWQATYTESTGIGGAVGYAQVDVTLKGGPTAPQNLLLVACARVVEARLGNLQLDWAGAGQARKSRAVHLVSASITESLNDNQVSMNVRVRRVAAPRRYLNLVARQVGTPLRIRYYQPQTWTTPSLYDGITPASSFATYLQSPCNSWHGISKVQAVQPQVTHKQGYQHQGGYAEIYRHLGLIHDDQIAGISRQQYSGYPYTHIEIQSYYQIDDGTLALPVADDDKNKNVLVFIPQHKPVAWRTFIIRAERAQQWPELPAPERSRKDPNGIVERLIETKVMPEEPKLGPDGKTLMYRVRVKLTYALSRALKTNERFIAGSAPWDTTTPRGNYMPAQIFKKGTIM